MYSKILSILLVTMIISGVAEAEKHEVPIANQVKNAIEDLGTGKNAYVEIKLNNKSKIKGYVKQVGDNSFTLIQSRTGEVTTIPYPAVKKLKTHNLSTDEKVLIGIGVTAAALFLALYVFVD